MASQKREYTRAKIAKAAKVNLETVRFYEKIGLLPNPPRAANGYRTYSSEHLKRLNFIRRGRELGFSNAEIGNLLKMMDGNYACDQVKNIALVNVSVIANKIADLTRMKLTLEAIAAECRGGQTPECAIIDKLLES